MYPLRVVLTNADERIVAPLRQEFNKIPAELEAEYADVTQALVALRPSAENPRLFVYGLRSSADLADLRRLSGTFIGQPILVLIDGNEDPRMLVQALQAGA